MAKTRQSRTNTKKKTAKKTTTKRAVKTNTKRTTKKTASKSAPKKTTKKTAKKASKKTTKKAAPKAASSKVTLNTLWKQIEFMRIELAEIKEQFRLLMTSAQVVKASDLKGLDMHVPQDVSPVLAAHDPNKSVNGSETDPNQQSLFNQPENDPVVEISKEQVMQELQSLAATEGVEHVENILKSFDAANVSALKPEQYGEVMDAITDVRNQTVEHQPQTMSLL